MYRTSDSVHRMVLTAVLSAVAALLMFFDFPVPLVPSFVKLDFSEVPVMLGAYFLGPVSGVAVALLKILLHCIVRGTATLGIGEAANFTGSLAYILPAFFIYSARPTKKGAILSLVIATLCVSAIVAVSDYFAFFPLYAKVAGVDVSVFVAMGSAVNHRVIDLFTLIFYAVFPFNVFKYGVTSVFVFLLYKRLEPIMDV